MPNITTPSQNYPGNINQYNKEKEIKGMRTRKG
jgi:hypothetical protein